MDVRWIRRQIGYLTLVLYQAVHYHSFTAYTDDMHIFIQGFPLWAMHDRLGDPPLMSCVDLEHPVRTVPWSNADRSTLFAEQDPGLSGSSQIWLLCCRGSGLRPLHCDTVLPTYEAVYMRH